MASLPALPHRPPQDASPTEALAFLWRGRWWIVFLTIVAAGLGVLYAQYRGTVWRARSLLYVQRDKSIGSEWAPWVESQNYAQSQAPLLRSLQIIEAALGTADLSSNAIFGDSKNRQAWLSRNLNVKVGEEDNLITVSLESKHVEDACKLVNSIVTAYKDYLSSKTRETATAALDNLHIHLKKQEGELAKVQKERIEFLEKNPGASGSAETTTVATERLGELTRALTEAELEALTAKSALEDAEALRDAPDLLQRLPEIAGLAFPRRNDTELNELKERRRSLGASVTGEHPDLQQIDAQIEEILENRRREDTELVASAIGVLRRRWEIADQKFTKLAARVAAEEGKITNSDPVRAEYEAILSRLKRTEGSVDALHTKIQSISLGDPQDSETDTTALVYEIATPTGALVTSSKRSIAFVGTFLGLVLGIGLAWLRSLFDQRLRQPQDLAGHIPLLATVPKISCDRRGIVQTWEKSEALGEAMRALRTVIYFGVRSGRNRILQLTSPSAGDGTSTITAGLALAMAQSGHSTLIVDANVDSNAQSRLFGIEGDLGLCQVLAGAETAADAIIATGVPNLFVLPAGLATRRRPDLFDDARLAEVLQELASDFDRVVVDSPPILEDVDARIIAAVCDESVLVLRQGKSTRSIVEAAQSVIASVGGRISGAVLNGSAGSAALGVNPAMNEYGNGSTPIAETPVTGRLGLGSVGDSGRR